MAKSWGDMRNTALKGKLTISTRYSILDSIKNRGPRTEDRESRIEVQESRIEVQESSIEYRVSRIEDRELRIETIE